MGTGNLAYETMSATQPDNPRDAATGPPGFSCDLPGQGFLVHVPAGKVEDGAPEFFGGREGDSYSTSDALSMDSGRGARKPAQRKPPMNPGAFALLTTAGDSTERTQGA
jgi:hypothetical protein